MPESERLEVVCAIIRKDGKIMAVRRKEGQKMAGEWEFPGGKIRDGESPEETIVREIREELEIGIIPEEALPRIEYEYPEFFIRLYPFNCRWVNGTIKMHVHDKCQWLDRNELFKLKWSKADQELITHIKDLL